MQRWSPDGRWIAYSSRALGEPEDSSRIYLTQLFNLGPPRLLCSCERIDWEVSPDWKWLAYSHRTPGEPVDSIRTYLIQPFNLAPPRLMGNGRTIWWPDSENVLVFSQMRTLRYSIATGLATQVGPDSTWVLPTQGAKQLVFFDWRKGWEGWWAASLDVAGKQKGEARKLFPSGGEGVVYRRDFVVYTKGNEIWRLWRLSGKEERIGRTLPGDTRLWTVSKDGRELLWVKQEDRAKLVLVKNLFE